VVGSFPLRSLLVGGIRLDNSSPSATFETINYYGAASSAATRHAAHSPTRVFVPDELLNHAPAASTSEVKGLRRPDCAAECCEVTS